MRSINRNGNVNCESCGNQTTRKTLECHKKRCSTGTLCYAKGSNFSTTCQTDLSFHIAKKHSTTELKNAQKCRPCGKDFHCFFSLRLHRQKFHGANSRSEAKIIEIKRILKDVDDRSLQEELKLCKNFLSTLGWRMGYTESLILQWVLLTRFCWIKS